MVEVITAIALVGIGITSTVAALTKLNAFAGASRNATGAYTAAMNQIDLIQSSPGVPTSATVLIQPPPPSGGATPPPPIPTNGIQAGDSLDNVPIYGETAANQVVVGRMKTTVTPNISATGVTTYQATVTVSWQYLGRGPVWSGPPLNRWEYQLTMNTVRASDQ